MRLDVYLTENGLSKSRNKSRELIEAGLVRVGGVTVTKPSLNVSDTDRVEVVGEVYPFVGRGGIKLDGALSKFGIDVKGMTAVDIGASSGGFTDCLLKRGAMKVYAVDSGADQLDETLKNDVRVVNIEHCNARNLDIATLGEFCDIAVADLSFISSTYIIPRLPLVLKDTGIYVGLIKPQFECGREAIGKNGIVRNTRYHRAAIMRVIESLESNGFGVLGVVRSDITGGDGNKEFLVHAVLGRTSCVTEKEIADIVGNGADGR